MSPEGFNVFWANRLVAIFAIITALWLIFSGLGSHALWDDEAMDALNAESIIANGDTVGWVGSNLVAYRNGLLLVDGRQQGMPPLPGYLAASSIRLFGTSSLTARAPFAACGVVTVVVIMLFASSLGCSWIELLVTAIAILGNVSFLLFFRNCHYYGPGILFTTICLITYFRGLHSRLSQFIIGLFSALLLFTNYTWFVALYICLIIDIVISKQGYFLKSFASLFRILILPFIAGLVIIWKWNPLGTKLGSYLHGSTVVQKVELFFWNWRDMNVCEYISYGILFIALVLAVFHGNVILRRLLIALTVYVLVITALSTQLLESASLADIRYMAGALPICIAITAVILVMAVRKQQLMGVALTIIACGTSLLNGGTLRFLPVEYISEILLQTEDPYKPAAKWIREHVRDGDSVWVLPDYMVYPLMYHAPGMKIKRLGGIGQQLLIRRPLEEPDNADD